MNRFATAHTALAEQKSTDFTSTVRAPISSSATVDAGSAYGGNQAALRRLLRSRIHLQPKLEIGAVDDPLEHEADRVAEQVLRMPEPDPPSGGTRKLQRKCAECEEEEEKKLQRRANSAGALAGQPAPDAVHQVLAQPGRPLDRESRAYFEPRLGIDLGGVRVHDDSDAVQSSRMVGARAYTVGNHIAFADRVDPQSQGGMRLLAHELAHVVQQSNGGPKAVSRDDAPAAPAPTGGSAPSGASAALTSAVDRIAQYRSKATSKLANSGLAPEDAAKISRNLATCEASEQQLRGVAQAGNDTQSANVLAAFTMAGMRQVFPNLTRVQPKPAAVATTETPDAGGAGVMTYNGIFSTPIEREAERVANELVPSGSFSRTETGRSGVLRRLLDGADAQQTEQAIQQAGPAIVAGTGAAVAAAATAPLWVWIAVAVVVVAVVVGVAIWIYTDSDSGPEAKGPQNQPKDQPKTETDTPPQTKTDTVPKECVDQAAQLSKRGCGQFEARVMKPDPRNPQADVYCHDITGSPCEFWLDPKGAVAKAKFDGIAGNDVIECKCGYDKFLDDLNSDDNFRQRRARTVLDGLISQALSHLRYTDDCGLNYIMYVSSKRLEAWLQDQLGPQIKVVTASSEECD